MEIKYQFFENEKLLIQKFKGSFSVSGYMQYISFFMKDRNLYKINKIINDFRDMDIEELSDRFFTIMEKMTEIRRNILKKVVKRKSPQVVFWVSNPNATVMAHLFIKNLKNSSNYQYFSSIDKIMAHLKLSSEFDNLDKVIDGLSNSFKSNDE